MAGTYFHNPMLQVISVVRCRPVFPAARAEAGIRWMHPRSLRNSGLAEDTAGPVDGMCRAYRRLKLSPHKCCKQDLLQNERLPALSFRPFSPCQFDPTPRVNSPLPPGSIRPFPSCQFAPSPRVNSPLPLGSIRPFPSCQFAPSLRVISTCPRCHLDLPPLSSRPQGRDLQRGKTRFLGIARNVETNVSSIGARQQFRHFCKWFISCEKIERPMEKNCWVSAPDQVLLGPLPPDAGTK